MSARAYRAAESLSPADQFREHSDYLRWELAPEERVGAPLVPKRKRWWLRGVMLLALVGGGWAFAQDPSGTCDWASQRLASAVSLGEALLGDGRQATPATETTTPPLALSPLQLLDAAVIETAGGMALEPAGDPASNGAALSEPAAASPPAEPADEPAPASADVEKPAPLPPLPPLTDPLQKRAEAVGLHPELSRALLKSLTAADFKNAGIAIKKAIAETPDDAVLVWPPQPKPGIARFRIHFVPGISAACRRYVVGVGKHGWLTTALPMEKCGVKPRPKPAPASVRPTRKE